MATLPSRVQSGTDDGIVSLMQFFITAYAESNDWREAPSMRWDFKLDCKLPDAM